MKLILKIYQRNSNFPLSHAVKSNELKTLWLAWHLVVALGWFPSESRADLVNLNRVSYDTILLNSM